MKVLVVEDQAEIAKVLVQLVETAGFQAIVASSLAQARHLFVNGEPETLLCAIVDYTLPDAPHGEAIKYFVEAYLPTMVMVDNDHSDVREAMFTLNVVDYFQKGNVQVYGYISRLIIRLEKNRAVNIAIVEPDSDARGFIENALKRYNFNVVSLKDASRLAEIIDQYGVGVVLLTEKQSYQTISALRDEYNKDKLVIIGMASGGQNSSAASLIKSGANDYIIRPFGIEELLCRVQLNVSNQELVYALNEAAHTDWLTGLYNRRYFFTHAFDMLNSPSVTSVALLDIDHFKRINDTYGHDAGDAVLQACAGQFKHHFPQGLIARMGGEEFCILVNLRLTNFYAKLEQLREDIANLSVRVADKLIQCTVSIGIAEVNHGMLDDAVNKADKFLYAAKSAGRNTIKY